ncbi:anthranilate synthase component I [Alkalihalobacterium alkalinitrilicum]|uniref:anthranilate synthase component I n=1 Tax=Alkalihalobacterium alkalinitrilicum TaxID=427920 RepID=UPI000994EB6A|nr:anthranilate synthase component I [Alkalihalobacterium alkalinitrilicum]
MLNTSLASYLEDAKKFRTVPIIGHLFADTLTPIQIFRQLEKDAVYLLESKDEQSPWSRFSFIGLYPKLFLSNKGNNFLIKEQETTIHTASSFQDAFDYATKYVDVKPIKLPVPFHSGMVGHVSYDAVEQFERVLAREDDKKETVHFMFCELVIAYDHHKKEMYLISLPRSGSSDAENKDIFNETAKTLKRVVNQMMESSKDKRFLPPPTYKVDVTFENVQSNYTKTKFISDVERIKEYIRAGDVFQAVLSQRFEVDINVSGLDIYRVLSMVNPSPYLFYIKIGDTEIIGSSPERLVQIQDGHMEIHPIAGTRPRGKTQVEDHALAQDLLADEKERAEHYMLVDLARNDIGRVAKYGSVETPVLLEVGNFSHVMHIISKVTGRLQEGTHPLEAFSSSFPAGTVSGAPKIRAMEILKEIEPTERGIYAGAIGYFGFDGNIDSCIAIRTLVIKNKKAYVQAGAGIVADSIPENEYEETKNKAKALLHAVQLAETMVKQNAEEAIGNV